HRCKAAFAPAKLSDPYTDKVLEVIRRKQKGETVTVEEPEAPEEEAPDLMEALRASIEAHSGASRRPSSRRSPRRTSSGRRSSRSRSGRSTGQRRRVSYNAHTPRGLPTFLLLAPHLPH